MTSNTRIVFDAPWRAACLAAAIILGTAPGTQCVAQEGNVVQVRPKLALVIGNSDYDEDGKFTKKEDTKSGRLYDLRNACNDAELIAARLVRLGWLERNVIIKCNVKKVELLQLLEEFTQRYMSSTEPFGFIYYAGHGVQVDDDTYIFGVDTKVDMDQTASIYRNFRTGHLFQGGIRLRQEIIATFGDPGSGSLFVVLDACRENPLTRELRARNIANVSAPRKGDPVPGIKHLYSTASGRLAGDGIGGNSPFAAVFAKQMLMHPSVDYVIRGVVDTLYRETKDTAIPQIPDEVGSFRLPPPDTCFGACGG